MFDALVRLCDAAKVANGNAQEILKRYRRKPDFSYASNSGIPQEAKAQERAAARNHLLYEQVSIKYIQSAVHKSYDADTWDATYLVQRAVASVLRSPPVFVGERSYPTAHEAAIAMGEAVLDAWQHAGGYDAVERAPDRMHATQDGYYADIAIEVSVDLWRRLRRLRKGLPADLWGQIQLEFQAALDRLEAEEQAAPAAKTEQGEGDGGAPSKRPRKGKGGKPALSQVEEEKRLETLKDWWQAQETGVKRKDFCRDKGIKVSVLKRYVNWHGTRRIRDTN